ncbi:MAG TPA: zinc ABC transporter substrate-binding protein [Gemmataceae bacterium]|jgi:ABC-type Zn uptake system ZnuABC Zn-binding protein ZnuA|nr:zinc ABC transporter substrate-binding protein [Gemmataceae bacterium]
MKRLAYSAVLVAGLAVAVGFVGCSSAPNPWKDTPSPRVATTFPPLYCFAKNVLGDHGDAHSLSDATGPHHYDPSTEDSYWLRGADLFVASGLGLDKFADRAEQTSQNARLAYLKVGDKLPKDLLLAAEHEDEHDKGKPGHAHEHEHGEFDPHVWLGTPQAIRMVEIIRDELKRLDPPHAEDYDKNAAKYAQALKDLHKDGKDELAKAKDRKIISFHDSLRYFAKSYDLTIVDVIEKGPGEEATTPEMINLVKKCVEEKVRVIAVEPQYPKSTSARVLQEELQKKNHKVTLVEIDPLETADPKELQKEGARWYEKKMRGNLRRLAEALK